MIIDTHGHVTGPAELYEFLRGFINVSGGAGRAFRRFPISDERLEESIKGHLDEIDRAGTDFQLIAGPSWAVPSAERRVALVMSTTQQVNDMVAQCVRLHPDRFAGIGVLPLGPEVKPKDCIQEMERCSKELGFVGFNINPDPGEGSVEFRHMGDDYWYPIYEKLVELDAPGIIHGGSGRYSDLPEFEYQFQEETVSVWGILRSPSVFTDFPDLKLVVPHGGSCIPFQYGRARGFRLNERARRGDDVAGWEPFEDTLRRLYFDTALFDVDALELLFRLCGTDRCLFGADMPGLGSVVDPRTERPYNDVKSLIDSIPWLSESDRRGVYEDNARKVYSRLPVAVGGVASS